MEICFIETIHKKNMYVNEMINVLSIFQGAGRKIPGGATLVFQVEMVAFL